MLMPTGARGLPSASGAAHCTDADDGGASTSVGGISSHEDQWRHSTRNKAPATATFPTGEGLTGMNASSKQVRDLNNLSPFSLQAAFPSPLNNNPPPPGCARSPSDLLPPTAPPTPPAGSLLVVAGQYLTRGNQLVVLVELAGWLVVGFFQQPSVFPSGS